MGRSFASKVSSPRWKWVVLVFWLVLAGASAPLAAGLLDEQNNEISSWLPGDAESTLALEQQIALGSDPDLVPAVVVYERADGLTAADLDAIEQDAQAFAQSEGLDGEVIGPIPSEDGQAAQVIVPLNLGPSGWEALAAARRRPARRGRGRRRTAWTSTSPARSGSAADSAEAFAGHRRHPARSPPSASSS